MEASNTKYFYTYAQVNPEHSQRTMEKYKLNYGNVKKYALKIKNLMHLKAERKITLVEKAVISRKAY